MESLHVYTTPIGDKWHSRKGSAQNKGKHLCCIAAIRSKNENWWAESMECYTYPRNVTDVLSGGKTPCERRFGQPFKRPIPFGSSVEYHPTTAESLAWIVPRIRTIRGGGGGGEFGRVTYWSQTLKNWRRWTHRKSARKDSMRKR